MLTSWAVEKDGQIHSVHLEEEKATQQAVRVGGLVHRMLSHAGLIARIASLEAENEQLRLQMMQDRDA